MDHRFLEIVACPVCKGKLNYNKENEELVCKVDRLAFAIREGIPVLLTSAARQILEEEVNK